MKPSPRARDPLPGQQPINPPNSEKQNKQETQIKETGNSMGGGY